MFYSFLQSFGKLLLDAVFPQTCFGCGRLGEFVCAACREALPFDPHEGSRRVWSATHYRSDVIRKLIPAWKYQNLQALTPIFGELLIRTIHHFHEHVHETPTLIPVPLHRRRERVRGFHQTLQLAQDVGSKMKWPVESHALIKRFPTRAQMQSDGSHRRQHLSGSFGLAAAIPPGPLFLIDDVVTTGSTLAECTRVLAAHTTSPIFALTIASSP